jgi:hypothetical protein
VTTVPMEDTVVLSVVVAAALSGRIRMVSPIARVSSWLTKRAETPSDPPGLVVDERVAKVSLPVLMSPGSISSWR